MHSRIAAHLNAAGISEGPVTVHSAQPLAGGACQDLLLVDLQLAEGDRRLVLRSDARRSLPGSLSRREEYAVIQAAVAAGVRTPAARYLVRDLVRPGADAYFMDYVEGEAIGRRVLREPALAQARERLPEELAEQLARIHRVTPADHPELRLTNFDAPGADGAGEDGAAAALRFSRAMIDAMKEPHPALELALRWLEEHQPPPRPRCLLHGDFRTGNFLVGPEGLRAVLDWEFAHFGDAMEDLGWLCMRDWRFGRLDRPAGGFATRERFYEAYERHSGQPVDRRRVHYYEVLGNVRWAAGSVFQGERVLSGEETDIELLAVARRASEMEYEALRLIEKGC